MLNNNKRIFQIYVTYKYTNIYKTYQSVINAQFDNKK